MRPARVAIGATGPSNWVQVDYIQSPFGVGFRCTVQEGGSLTFKVQHGFTDLVPLSLANLTRSTTTATATWRVTAEDATHGMQSGDCVFMQGYGAPFDGVYTVTVSSGTVFTYTVANSGPTGSTAGLCQRTFVGDHPVVTGATASTDGNYAFPPNMIRLNATAYTSGVVTLSVNQGLSS